MTPTIQDKATIINDRWVTIPFIRTDRGDRPAIDPRLVGDLMLTGGWPPAAEAKSTDLTTPRKDEADGRRS